MALVRNYVRLLHVSSETPKYRMVQWLTLSTLVRLSLAYSLISLAFQINFTGGNPITSETQVTSTISPYSNADSYGHGTFPVYWMVSPTLPPRNNPIRKLTLATSHSSTSSA